MLYLIAASPIATFSIPETLLQRVLDHMAILELPVPFAESVAYPIAIFPPHEVLEASVSVPTQTLLFPSILLASDQCQRAVFELPIVSALRVFVHTPTLYGPVVTANIEYAPTAVL